MSVRHTDKQSDDSQVRRQQTINPFMPQKENFHTGHRIVLLPRKDMQETLGKMECKTGLEMGVRK
jgi:hypothetical protein